MVYLRVIILKAEEREMEVLKERVNRLEKVLEDFIVSVREAQLKTEMEIQALKEEMRVFKEEMRVFKEEMRQFQTRTEEYFKRMDEENRRRNKEWSNLAKKMGTIVEDLIAPAIRPVLTKYFDCDVNFEGQRILRRKDGKECEVDMVASCEDKVFMVEARSTPRIQDIPEIKEKGKRFLEFFPEFGHKRLIIIFGSISFPENVIKEASREGIYVMAWREWEYMDILNFEEVKG